MFINRFFDVFWCVRALFHVNVSSVEWMDFSVTKNNVAIVQFVQLKLQLLIILYYKVTLL